MKLHLFIVSVSFLSLVSCKKDRTCNCTVTTNQTTTIRNQTSGTSVNLLGLPVVLTPASDTTVSSPETYSSIDKTNYNKVSKSTMHKNCAATHEESSSENYTSITAGSSTVTTTKAVTKKYACKIE